MKTRFLLAAAAVGVAAASASAQLTGTTLNIEQSFTGIFATTTNGPHTYGGAPTIYPDPGFPQFTWTASSPAAPPPAGFDNSINCDYAAFALPDFAGEQTTITITTIAVNVASGSARVINSAGTQIGTGTSGGSQIQFNIAIDDILVGPTDTMVVAWDNEGANCYPDCNGDGALTVADFGCFQTRFVAGDPYADCNGDGIRTVADFGCFQTRFVQGCP